MSLNPYLLFNGQCEAAFEFYAQCLGGKTEIVKFAGSPCGQQIPEDYRDKVMHARLTSDDLVLMGGDALPDHRQTHGGFSVALQVKQPAEAERLFNALADNGSVKMPLQKTFWSAAFGMLVDQFGVPWMVNCEQAV